MEKVKRALALYINYYVLRRTPTFVYSVERSGSVALLHSLQSHGVFTIGAHYLSAEKLAQPQYRSGAASWASQHVIKKRRPAKIVSMVRSPIENMLSTFARETYGASDHRSQQIVQQAEPSSVELSKEFCQTYLESDQYLHPLHWFDTEFRSALEVDVYGHAFDKQLRFARFRDGVYDVLLLGTELEDRKKAKLVAEFLGIPQLEISGADLASQTSASRRNHRLPPGKPGDKSLYAQKYQRLKEHVVIPENYLESIVNSRYMRHFFSDEQRETIRQAYRDETRNR